MDQSLIYVKTPLGEESVKQTARVIQRNHRLVLVQVDGKVTVGDLGAKIGNPKLVEKALTELESAGLIVPAHVDQSVWEQSKSFALDLRNAVTSQFSTFGPKSVGGGLPGDAPDDPHGPMSRFTSFGKPVLPVEAQPMPLPQELVEPIPRMTRQRQPFQFRPIMVLWGGLGLIVALFLLATFYPYDNYRPQAEAALSKELRQPVKIGGLSLVWLPRPAFVLEQVSVGGPRGIRIESVAVPQLLSLLFSRQPHLKQIEVNGIRASLTDLSGLWQGMSVIAQGEPAFTLHRVSLKNLAVALEDVGLSGLSGEMYVGPDGTLNKVVVQTPDRLLTVEGVPEQGGLRLALESFGWRPGSESPFVFESLQAKGTLVPGHLEIREIDSTFLGGIVKGSWSVDWGNGVSLQGDLHLERLSIPRITAIYAAGLKMEGEMGGAVHFQGVGESWRSAWQQAVGFLDGEVVRGSISGIDLGEALRRSGGRGVLGGVMRFDRLRGKLSFTPQAARFSGISLEAGLLTATGNLLGQPEGVVEGEMDVQIHSNSIALRGPVRVTGKLPNLQAIGNPR